ncbi:MULTISPECIES: glycoside hydrolase family 26 protein [Streptomyces]|uniref:Beta-mannanase n=1 Tax=Streptomyces dengpaensis TaxID=2049881 RepID=A0ABN5I1W2_9ACTN|nr:MULTISPECIES: glycosyl hydrolase [Streptomyces]AVH57043.1 beta-mannanase [Streptomyces dengpaensis]PIB09056.1 beta-mannanase [Streptomyces sp. HG99]
MRVCRVTAALLVPLTAAALALTACSPGTVGGRSRVPATAAGAQEPPYDVRPLLQPAKKYFGVARAKAPHSMEPVDDYTRLVGKRPNLIRYYAAWGDGFDATGVRNAWNTGALTIVSWEPQKTSLTEIADGETDAYIKEYATAVRTLNIPVAISFADEMNGDWEKWGITETTPKEYVRAWRHIHDVFEDVGATHVIWAWSPNIIKPDTHDDLSRFYPGENYVDWVGLIGYFTDWDPHTFEGLFGATMAEVRRFSREPMLVLETGAMPGELRATHVRALFEGIAPARDIVGFAWFDYKAREDWRLTVEPEGLAEFRRLAADDLYGFDARKAR